MEQVRSTWLRLVLAALALVALSATVTSCGFGCGQEKETFSTFATLYDPSGTTLPAHTEVAPDDSSGSHEADHPQNEIPPLPATSGDPTPDMMTNWEYFFDSRVPVSTKVQLLENGEQHAGELADLATQSWAQDLCAFVSRCSYTEGGTTGRIVYDLYTGDTLLAPQLEGTAVFQDGVWKVSEETFTKFQTATRGVLVLRDDD